MLSTHYFKSLILAFLLLALASSNLFSQMQFEEIIKFAKPSSSQYLGINFTLKNHGEDIYILYNYSDSAKYHGISVLVSDGYLAKFDTSGKEYFSLILDVDSLRLIPKSMMIDEEGIITVFSDYSTYIVGDYLFSAQLLNVRKFTDDGEEIYNYADTAGRVHTNMSFFPITLDKENIPVVIATFNQFNTFANKYDPSGKLLSSVKIDSIIHTKGENNEEIAGELFEVKQIQAAADGGFYCYGNREKRFKNGIQDTLYTPYLMKTNQDGVIEWKEVLFGLKSDLHLAWITSIADGGVVSAVNNLSNNLLRKYSIDGDLEWSRNLGIRATINKIFENSHGDIIVVGWGMKPQQTHRDKYIAKVSGEGSLIWEKLFGTNADEEYVDIIEYGSETETSDGKYYLLEKKGNIDDDIFTVDSLLVNRLVEIVSDVDDKFALHEEESIVFPNPVYDNLNIGNGYETGAKISIYDISGNKVLESDFRNSLDVSALPTGIYTIKIGSRYSKFVKE